MTFSITFGRYLMQTPNADPKCFAFLRRFWEEKRRGLEARTKGPALFDSRKGRDGCFFGTFVTCHGLGHPLSKVFNACLVGRVR